MYGKINELRSLLGQTPVICLTATATSEQQQHIIKILGMKDPLIIQSPPTKQNITYYVKSVGNDIDTNFTWLADILLKQGQDSPRILIFCGV